MKNQRLKRHIKIRKKINGTSNKPRLNIFRSNKMIYAQLIDDISQKTIIGFSDKKIKAASSQKSKKIDKAFEVGKTIAKAAASKKIVNIIFDRGGYKYHGRVKALADGAREGGLKF